jgi:glycosyltransferase involved in cell wall biosynthesis
LAFLLDALALLVSARSSTLLLIAGGGPQLPELQRQAAALGVADRVRFMGERTDVLALLDAADGFVFPSLSEGLSVSLLEAMAMEKPCVVSKIGPNQEVITERESGIFASPQDRESLAEAMAAIQDDRAFAARLGQTARRRVTEAFDARAGANQLMQLYASLCPV